MSCQFEHRPGSRLPKDHPRLRCNRARTGMPMTTVDGQNMQTLQHALCWTPAPPNLNVSARVLLKVTLGVWFLSSIGANALQVTLTLNFGGEGVVPERRGLNISSIYGSIRRPRFHQPSATRKEMEIVLTEYCKDCKVLSGTLQILEVVTIGCKTAKPPFLID